MTFRIHTYGCQMNVRDSEAVATLLTCLGHTPADDEAGADLVLVNSCSVRGKAEDKALGKLRLLCAGKRHWPNRIVGALGCMVQRLGPAVFDRVPRLDLAVGTRRQAVLPELVARAAAGEQRLLALGRAEDRDVPSQHAAGACTAYVTVLLGCDRRCAYCIVPDVRGSEYSRPAAEVLAEVHELVDGGVREVTLLGQSVMNYGRQQAVWPADHRSSLGFSEPFPRLLEAVAAIPGLQRLRFTSGHPSGCTAELVRAMAELPAVCAHLHLPVQSGSDRILSAMRRGYGRAGYLDAVRRLRAAIPGFALTSDVIVGFPGETVADFEETRTLIEAAGFDNAFVFKYSPRPGTPAAALMDDVAEDEKLRRNRVLLEDLDRLGQALNDVWVGRIVPVLAEGPSARKATCWSGRSAQNKIVIFTPTPGLRPGEIVPVRIVRAAPQTLHGEVAAAAPAGSIAESERREVVCFSSGSGR